MSLQNSMQKNGWKKGTKNGDKRTIKPLNSRKRQNYREKQWGKLLAKKLEAPTTSNNLQFIQHTYKFILLILSYQNRPHEMRDDRKTTKSSQTIPETRAEGIRLSLLHSLLVL